MSAQAVAKELNRLSYTDMNLLAAKLIVAIEKHPESHMVSGLNRQILADAMATLLQDMEFSPDPVDEAGNKHLKGAFSGRSKAIHVMPVAHGYQVSFSKYQAVDQRLPDAINKLLDQIAVHRAMGLP